MNIAFLAAALTAWAWQGFAADRNEFRPLPQPPAAAAKPLPSPQAPQLPPCLGKNCVCPTCNPGQTCRSAYGACHPAGPAPAPAVAPIPPRPAVLYRLADGYGQTYEHQDPAYLVAWVTWHNRQLAPAPRAIAPQNVYTHPYNARLQFAAPATGDCAGGRCSPR